MSLRVNNLKEFRERTKVSQEKLAGHLNVSRQTIISIEKGKYVPSLELAIKMSRHFGCRITDIFDI